MRTRAIRNSGLRRQEISCGAFGIYNKYPIEPVEFVEMLVSVDPIGVLGIFGQRTYTRACRRRWAIWFFGVAGPQPGFVGGAGLSPEHC